MILVPQRFFQCKPQPVHDPDVKVKYFKGTGYISSAGPGSSVRGPASEAQVDAPFDWRPGGHGFNPRRGRQHSFVEIDREIFSMVILSLPLI